MKKARSTYIRDTDGALMVEVKPNNFVKEEIARKFGLIGESDVLAEPEK